MKHAVDERWWEGRDELATLLETVGLTVWEWLCLRESPKKVKWNSSVGKAIYEDVLKENYWDGGGLYLPDITLKKMTQADESVRSSGLVREVTGSIAKSMIAERAQYDHRTIYRMPDLVGLRVLTETGAQRWNTIKAMQGFQKGLNFIKLMSRQKLGEMTVFHSPFKFNLELFCADCAIAAREQGIKSYVEVGPWCSRGIWGDPGIWCVPGIWLNGWRLICAPSA